MWTLEYLCFIFGKASEYNLMFSLVMYHIRKLLITIVECII